MNKFKINMSLEEFNFMQESDIIPFYCDGCGSLSQKTKKMLKRSFRDGWDKIYCSKECFCKNKSLNIPSKDNIILLIDKGLTQTDIGVFYNTKHSNVRHWIKKYNLQEYYSQSGNQSRRMSDFARQRLIDNPNHSFLKNRGISHPCEKVKQELRDKKFDFNEEVKVLIHLGYLYSADIVFEKYGVIAEINGSQHYHKGILTPYYQKRHDLLERSGWKVLEIPTENTMRYGFIDDLISTIISNNFRPSLEYKKILMDKLCACGNKIQKTAKACEKCYLRKKQNRPCPITREFFHYLMWNYGLAAIEDICSTSTKTVKRWAVDFSFREYPTRSYWANRAVNKCINDYQI